MGSFAGHVDEGTVFLLLGLWWTWNSFPDYIRAIWQGDDFYSRCSYCWPGKPRLPIEAILKVVFVSIILISEFVDSPHFVDEDNRITNLNKLQHLSIFGLFLLHGLIDLLTRLGVSLPRGFDRISGALAFSWLGLCMTYHSQMHDKDGMEKMLHILSTYPTYLVAICYALETVRPSWFLLHVGRIYGILILGSWYWHVAFFLYIPTPFPGKSTNPTWDHTDMNNVHFIVAVFGFHLIVHITIITLAYLLTALVLRVRGQDKPQYLLMDPLHVNDK